MSGGSFDYFYSRAPDSLRDMAASLRRMADECQNRAAGEPEKCWRTTGELVDLAALAEASDFLRMLSLRVGGMARVLDTFSDVTQAVEWWKSGDSGADGVIEAWQRLSAPRPPSSEGPK